MSIKKILFILFIPFQACAFGTSPPKPSPTPSPSPSPSPTVVGKKPLCGLVTMGNLGFIGTSNPPQNNFEEANAHPNTYKAVVILAAWNQLEPTQGSFNFSSIDSAIANIKTYNAKYPQNPLVGKLRVFGGLQAPAWAMALDNGPVSYIDPSTSQKVTLGHFWSQPYHAAWVDLQNHLAAQYNSNPLMGEVAITSCASHTAEPFIYASGKAEISALLAAGFTDSAMQACLSQAPSDYAAWTGMPLDYTFNPYHSIGTGTGVVNDSVEIGIMNQFRSGMGAMAVIANHGLQSPLDSQQTNLYAQIQTMGAPVEFQTDGPTLNQVAAFNLGLSTYHATELEVWDTTAAGGVANLSQAQLTQLAGQFSCH